MTLELNNELGAAARCRVAAAFKAAQAAILLACLHCIQVLRGLTILCLALSWLAVVATCLYLSCCAWKPKVPCSFSGLLVFPSDPSHSCKG